MTPGFDPTQVDWNNPDVEYLMKNFERAMADRRDEIVLLTKSNNQLASEKEQMASEKEQMASKNMELEERCLHLEAKHDKLIEMYNELRDGAGSGAVSGNTPKDSDAGSGTTTKQHSGDGQEEQLQREEIHRVSTAQVHCKKRG